MRRTLLLVTLVAGTALVLWWLGGAVWPGGGGEGDAAHRGDAHPPDTAQLRGLGPGASPSPSETPTPMVPDPPPDWPHGTVTGRVVGPDGHPLPDSGASLVGALGNYGNAVRYRDAPADADGRFVLHARPGLPSVVIAGALGHALVVGPRVRLEAGTTHDVGTLRLAPERRLLVRVLNEDGAPVEDVEVYLDSEREPPSEGWESTLDASELLASRSTDAEGRARFDMLPAGTWRVAIDTGAMVTRDQVRERVEADGEEVVFVLPSRSAPDALRLHLRLLGPDGEPVPQARVRLEAESCSVSEIYEESRAEPLELECAVGPVQLIVQEAEDAEGSPLGYGTVVLPDVRGLESPVEIRMERGATITGRVVWKGTPARWRVVASGWLDRGSDVCVPPLESRDGRVHLMADAQTEADGSFCLVGLPPGRFALGVEGPGRLRDRAPVAGAGESGVELEMVEEGRIEVHVLPPRGSRFGSPYLALQEWVGDGLQDRSSWFGGGGDRPDVRIFRIDDLRADGRYRLEAWGTVEGGHCPSVVLDDVVVREAPYVLQLEAAPHVRGVVEREDGTPVWGAQVRYRPWPGGELQLFGFSDGPWLGLAMTDAEGAFDLSGFGEQEIVLSVHGLGLALRDAPPNVLPGASGVRLVVVPARRISGRVSDPAGGILDGLYAAAVPDDGWPVLWTPTRVTADGFFEVRDLAPGRYRVVIWNGRDATDVRSAWSGAVKAGARDLRLALKPGAVLEGVVRDPTGRPLPGANVRLLGRWTNRADGADAEGRYRFTGIPRDVELDVEVATPTGRTVRRSVRITETATPTRLDVALPKR